jgi:hypothetical protein
MLALSLAAGCTSTGGVEVEFLLPAKEDLAPAGLANSEITLVTRDGDSTSSETRHLIDRADGLDMGNIPVVDGLDLAVELRTPTQRLIGYARAPGPVNVEPDTMVKVPMMVRRPFVYVSGNSIATYDPTVDATRPDKGYIGSIPLSTQPNAVVPTSDGGDLVVVSASGNGGVLTLVSTSTHEPSNVAPVQLSVTPSDAAVTHDNRYVVVGHSGANGGVSIVDLAAARAGETAVQFLPLGDVGIVAVGRGETPEHPGRAYALTNRAITAGCPTNNPVASKIIVIDLADPSQAALTLEPGVPIHDIAVSADGRNVVLADSCNNRIEKRNIVDDAQSMTLANLVDASAVTIFDSRVWAVGTAPPTGNEGARLVVVSIGIDGQNQARTEMQPSEERARSRDFDEPGQAAEQRIGADALIAFEIAVAPGGDHLALLVWGYYHGTESGSLLGQPVIPEMQMVTNEYILLEAGSAAIVQRVRSSCDIEWVSDPFNPPVLDDWVCSQAVNQDVATSPFEPKHISVLYGAR